MIGTGKKMGKKTNYRYLVLFLLGLSPLSHASSSTGEIIMPDDYEAQAIELIKQWGSIPLLEYRDRAKEIDTALLYTDGRKWRGHQMPKMPLEQNVRLALAINKPELLSKIDLSEIKGYKKEKYLESRNGAISRLAGKRLQDIADDEQFSRYRKEYGDVLLGALQRIDDEIKPDYVARPVYMNIMPPLCWSGCIAGGGLGPSASKEEHQAYRKALNENRQNNIDNQAQRRVRKMMRQIKPRVTKWFNEMYAIRLKDLKTRDYYLSELKKLSDGTSAPAEPFKLPVIQFKKPPEQ